MRAIFLFFALLAPILAFENNDLQAIILDRQARIMENEIKEFLECIRDVLKTGDAETGFPSFDPLTISELNLDLDHLGLQGLSGKVSIKDLNLAGVPDWDLEHLKISITIIPVGAKLQVKVEWPAGDVTGSYEGDISVFGHTATGSGAISGNLASLRFEVEGQALIKPVSIKSAKFAPSLDSSSLVIENLTIDGQDISGPLAALVEKFPALLEDNQDLINDLLNTVVIPAINTIIDKILHGGESTYNDIPIIGKCLPSIEGRKA